MKLLAFLRTVRGPPILSKKTGPLQCRQFQPDYVPRDPMTKRKKYKYPAVYDPYGPKPPPSENIVQLAERIASLPLEERLQIHPTLALRLCLPKIVPVSVEGVDLGPQGGSAGSPKTEEKKAEKTAFDVKLEKFDAASKIKVIKEVRAFTSLGLKEAKDLVEKAPVLLKQGVTKEEANEIIDKLKAIGGVAVME
ncbi:50S ribosomal protein L7/L12 [Thalictrum thalictroides]|uniref:50S ribosomal protein L7/L12 n=1 Tax=Thalictrum thalictroides TaxID=46969 RepID=A0A7J6WYR0_THATH|nr:50S ribosomal protein L7/L12 [Thalictrum thalictroides]